MTPQTIGGLARAASLSSQRRSEIASLAAQARWNMQPPKREPDCWINVYGDGYREVWYGNPRTDRLRAIASMAALKELGATPRYRLRVFIK